MSVSVSKQVSVYPHMRQTLQCKRLVMNTLSEVFGKKQINHRMKGDSQTNRARNALHRRELVLERPRIPNNPRHAHNPVVGYTLKTVSQGGRADQFKNFVVFLASDLSSDIAV